MTIAGVNSDVVAAGYSALVTLVVALAVLLGRTRERIARIEEWIRQHEFREGVKK